VDDLLGKHVAGVPAAWQAITLRHLLTHTSGIPVFTALPPYQEWKQTGPSPAMIFARLRDLPLEFSPGSRFQYSNSGYVLLGWVIGRVSGQTYRDYVKQNIFEPLGLADSGYDSTIAVIPQRAAGYRSGALGLCNANHLDMRVPHGAGGLYSTTGDLLKRMRALAGGKFLQPGSLAKMSTPSRAGYGFGLSVGAKNGRKRFAHGGGIDGFSSFPAYFPASGVMIVVLANVEGPAAAQLGGAAGSGLFRRMIDGPIRMILNVAWAPRSWNGIGLASRSGPAGHTGLDGQTKPRLPARQTRQSVWHENDAGY
jgi:CubicO group peptidase (beta-lactamase class C family)